jgi:RNA recognition motif. (a.k.a. RRM, RBD, or RNP domain)
VLHLCSAAPSAAIATHTRAQHARRAAAEFSVFVGDLAHSVTDAELLALFQAHYPSAFEARVVTDAATSTPKGFGFVRFAHEQERDRAISEMHGVALQGRSLRVSVAAKRQAAAGGVERSAFSRAVTQVRTLHLQGHACTMTMACCNVHAAVPDVIQSMTSCAPEPAPNASMLPLAHASTPVTCLIRSHELLTSW